METMNRIIEVFLLGAIGGSVPGPILAATFTEILNSGFAKSLKVIFRALIAESLVAIVVLLIFFSFNIHPVYFHVISIGGAAMLFWLALQVWHIESLNSQNKEIFTFGKILLLTLLNGGFWIFWITVCVPRAFLLKQSMAGGHLIFLIVFETGWLIMTILLAYLFSRFRPLLQKKRLVSGVFRLFALILVFFAMQAVFESVRFLLK